MPLSLVVTFRGASIASLKVALALGNRPGRRSAWVSQRSVRGQPRSVARTEKNRDLEPGLGSGNFKGGFPAGCPGFLRVEAGWWHLQRAAESGLQLAVSAGGGEELAGPRPRSQNQPCSRTWASWAAAGAPPSTPWHLTLHQPLGWISGPACWQATSCSPGLLSCEVGPATLPSRTGASFRAGLCTVTCAYQVPGARAHAAQWQEWRSGASQPPRRPPRRQDTRGCLLRDLPAPPSCLFLPQDGHN